MALILQKSIFFHIPSTGGAWVREVLRRSGQSMRVELGNRYSCPAQVDAQDRFTFTFVRHPLSWYESYFNLKRHYEKMTWNPGIPFDRLCRSRTFDQFIEKVIENFPGYVSCMYKMFTEIDTPRELNFIGRQEVLREDLAKALTQAGEMFNPILLKDVPGQNISPQHPQWDKDLRQEIIKLESFALKRFSYEKEKITV